jgi:hypothetical protein
LRRNDAPRIASVCIDEVIVVAVVEGAPQFEFRLTVDKPTSVLLTASTRTPRSILRICAERARKASKRNEFVRSIAAWFATRAVAAPRERHRLAPKLVIRTPPMVCTHEHLRSSGRVLVACTRCGNIET